MDEVNFWIGKINLEDKDYFQGLKMLSLVQDKNLQPSIEAMKAKSISEVTDVETLKMMREEYPERCSRGKSTGDGSGERSRQCGKQEYCSNL